MKTYGILIMFAVAAWALAPQIGQAEDPIAGVTVADFSSQVTVVDRAAAHLTDGSGMQPDDTHGFTPNGTMWTTNGTVFSPNDINPFVTFDLGGLYNLEKITVWNYNENAEGPTCDFGVDECLIEVSSTGPTSGFTTLGTYNFAVAPGYNQYLAGEVFNVSAGNVQYVKFNIKSNHHGVRFPDDCPAPDMKDLVGLSEVRFAGTLVPEPSTLVLLIGFGLFALAGCRRRR